ncbi:thioredoxin family protein, partial [Candidatus Bipolaricaulota bacterium]|nr:thioredoxin family protein [Candidatus Bipolaricaulota bacterium]
QQEQAQGIGAVLCTSCVGIEEARTEDPELSLAAIEEIESLAADIALIVFYAPWCHACPFAEGLVELIAGHNDRITFAFSNVEEEPELAAQHAVIRSNRTIVPAVLRVDTGEIVFGVENLEERLLAMLRRSE